MPSSLDFDLYEALEVGRDASAQEITASYRRLARFHHPDKNIDNADATAKFQKVQAAYEVLSDEYKRRVYDEPESSSGFGGGSAWSRPQAYYDSSDDDIYDMEKMFNIFFQNMFAQASPRQGPFQNPQPYVEMERSEREARRRDEAAVWQRKEKSARDAVEHAKREAKTKSKKAMEESAAALKEKAEIQSRLKMENIFASHSCVTDFDKQAYCEHCSFWPKEQMKRKFKCLNCGQKRGMTQYKCPYCALVLCQHCFGTKQFTKDLKD